ncbi:MAG: hypothetical protein QOG64_2551 [Acidimicrobiaceae bacterium]|nr:hypothetical protein [Acidimicrobiaceae bacterium]
MAHRHWPLFDLRIRTPRVELRLPNDDDAVLMAELAAEGVHDPATMPFSVAWTDVPSPQQERNSLQHYWLARAQWQPESWAAGFGVWCEGRLVGAQAVQAKDFGVRRVVETGSWIGLAFQGRGIGKEMRAAVLHLAFAGLGAVRAESGAWHDNLPSQRVSRALGYVENGDEMMLRRGRPERQIRFKLERADWEHRRRDDIEIHRLDACLELFGVTEPRPAP